MNNEKLIPKLRFSGFTDEWNEVTLNDVATFSKGKGISKNDISDYGIECVRYGELYTKYNEMIYNVESKTNLDKNELKLSEKDDILIPCSGETAIDLATASCIQKDQVAIGGDITVIKTNQYAPFITYYLNQKKTEIAKYAQGVSIVHLYPKDFKVMNIRIPSFNEQKKIIALLEEITKKEQLLKSKYQEYQDFKKYLMQEIFAQKLRFDFDNEWKKVKLKNIVERVTRKNTNLETDLALTISAEYGLIDQEEFFNKIVASKSLKNYYLIKNGEFAYNKSYSNGYPYGAIKRLDDYPMGALSTLYICFKPTEINSDYLKEYFETTFWYKEIYSIAVEGARNHGLLNINVNDFFNTKHLIPQSTEEQEKIADLFKSINSKIDAVNNDLNLVKNFKKGLLQQMFI